jgi:molybdopterin molybdotransferase
MITVEEAYHKILSELPSLGVERRFLTDITSYQCTEKIVSDRDYPPFNRAMMDGITLSFEAYLSEQKKFFIEGVIKAGEESIPLKDQRHCFEIMTGAPVPENCDLVIPYEHLDLCDGSAVLKNSKVYSKGENIHLHGSDCKKRDEVLKANLSLNGPHVGIAASMGYEKIEVKRKPKILIISTGNELVEISQVPKNFQIRRSNVYALKATLELNHFFDITLHHVNDDIDEIKNHLDTHYSSFDIFFYSGGVSKGKFDFLPIIFETYKINKIFHEISQRPGKPMWFGVKDQKAFFGLPGNPISSLICLTRYFIPHKKVYAKLAEDITFKKELTYFCPVQIQCLETGQWLALPKEMKNSGEFTALAETSGFIELPKEKTFFKKGECYPFFPWKSFLC